MTFLTSILIFPEVRERISDIFKTNLNDLKQEKYAYNYPFNGLSLRLVVWKLGIEHLYDDGLLIGGVGTGDATDYLNRVYSEHGLLDGGYVNHNAHNEYVQMLLSHGLIGFFFLNFIYIWGLYRALSTRVIVLLVFILIFALASWSESVLTVNKGIVFLSFYFPLLLLLDKQET
jgi:uncharacterized membrane protein